MSQAHSATDFMLICAPCRPDVDRVISPSGETFGQFSSRILSEHYDEK